MSNKRRKSIGSHKIKANRLRRVVRGSLKAGQPLPGEGRTYSPPAGWQLDGKLEAQGVALRSEVDELRPYWGGRL